MEEKEYNNIYAVPANYTDSGKLLGGMLEIRNTVEAIILVALLGYPELVWIPVGTTAKVIIMTVTLIPLGVLALMGIGGDSLMQFFTHMIRFWVNRRNLHYRRIGYRYDQTENGNKKKPKKKAQKRKRRSSDPES